MKSSLHKQIYQNMNLKDTEELLEIWHEHNTDEWREETFEIVKEILVLRLGEIPSISKEYQEKKLVRKVEEYCVAGRLKKALKECDLALKEFPNSASLHNCRGLIFNLWDDKEEALKNYQLALELNPDFEDAKENLKNLQKENQQEREKVQEESRKTKEKAQREIAHSIAEDHLYLALDHIDNESFYEALQECNAAIENAPDYASAYYYRGTIYDEIDNVEKALENFQKALWIDPGHNEAFGNLLIMEEEFGETFFNSDWLDKLDTALELFYTDHKEKALELCNRLSQNLPNIAYPHNALGMVFEEIEELEDARDLYQEATKLNPRFFEAFINLRNVNCRLEERLYRQVPIDEEMLIDFDETQEWEGDIEPVPGWVYANETTYLLRGTPGHRILPGKSGYDPVDTYAEEARIDGIIIRALFTLKFKTHNPIYLLFMMVFGLFLSLPLILELVGFVFGVFNLLILSILNLDGFLSTLLGQVAVLVISSPIWIPGVFLLGNVYLSFITKRPEGEDDSGNAFF